MNLNQLRRLSKTLHKLDGANPFITLKQSSAYRKFYFSLIEQSLTDEDYLRQFYKSTADLQKYRSFKTRYKEKLLNALYNCTLEDAINLSEYREKELTLMKGVAVSTMLRNLNLRQESIDLLINLEKLADNVDNRYFQLYIDTTLIEELTFTRNGQRVNYFYERQNKTHTLLNEIIKTHRNWSKIAGHYLSISNSLKPHEQLNIKNDLLKIKDDQEILNSFFGSEHLFTSLSLIANNEKNTEEQIEIISEALTYFKSADSISKVGLHVNNLRLGIAYLFQKNFEKALSYLIEALNYSPNKKLISWHNHLRYIFITHMYLGDFKAACETISEIQTQNNLSKLPAPFSEPWYIYEAFIHFLIKTKKIDSDSIKDIPLRSFRLSRFMNEVSHFSKDKKGYNITINILQALFLIADKKYDAATDKFHALKQYSYRYLRKPEFIRPRTFINMLQSIPSGHFHKKLVEQRSAKHRKVLEDNPMDYSEKSLGLEIVPYEQLWQEVLHLLDPKQN